MTGYLIGAAIAVAVAVLGRRSGLDRERAFYTTVTIVVAHYYVLFAAMSGSFSAVLIETVVMSLFIAAAVAGFRVSMSLVGIALTAHGVFDAFHAHVITNPGVPAWWPAFCLGFDIVAGVWLIFTLRGHSTRSLSVRRLHAFVASTAAVSQRT